MTNLQSSEEVESEKPSFVKQASLVMQIDSESDQYWLEEDLPQSEIVVDSEDIPEQKFVRIFYFDS